MLRPPATLPLEGLPFPELPEVPNFSSLEREVLEYWETEGIYEETLNPDHADGNPFDGATQEGVTYDLPPVTQRFPSPTDLLSGFLHDSYSRLRTMRGWVVPRPWIRVQHGIPVELEAQRRLELKDRAAIEVHGVPAFVAECAAISEEKDEAWRYLLRRQGHWISCDEGFVPTRRGQTASVWWAFKKLFEKDLIYEGEASAPYSEELGTPLAPFEVRFTADGPLRSPYGGEETPERKIRGWFLRLPRIRKKLKARINSTVWFPSAFKKELLDWVETAGDWCLSRERYWGVPLPVWRTDDETKVLGSVEDLVAAIGGDVPERFDRRSLDALELPSSAGGPPLRRVPQVLDPWFEAACLPFARFCYPEAGTDEFKSQLPGDFATQSHRHARGWWFVLALLFDVLFQEPFVMGVVGHAEVRSSDGEEVGELSPEEALDLFEEHGSDSLRWNLLSGGVATDVVRLPTGLAPDLITLWKLAAFFCEQANDAGVSVSSDDWPEYPESDLDRWLLTKLHRCCSKLEDRFRYVDYGPACGLLANIYEDLAWWRQEALSCLNTPSKDPEAWRPRLVTMHRFLVTAMKLTAPFAPFVAELIYLSLTGKRSVHLERWPDLPFLPSFPKEEKSIEITRGRS